MSVPHARFLTLAAAALFVLAACSQESFSLTGSEGAIALNGTPASPEEQLVKEIRTATARFHSLQQAARAGYVSTVHCVANPVGAMGVHFANAGLTDPVFDPLHPETLLYEPTENGGFRLVAVEYQVIDVGQPAPSFAGQSFDVGGSPIPVPHWTLHVWIYEENPLGVFEPFNPEVSCPA